MLSEIRIAARTLAKSPAFTCTAIAALTLGIGANTAVFSVVNALLLNPPGISDPDRVVSVKARYDKLNLKSIPISVPDFTDVRDSRQIFEHVAVEDGGNFNYTGSSSPERLEGAQVSLEWFYVFRASPLLGRVFQAEEDQPDANQVVILSYGTWKRIFGADAGIIGRTIQLNNQAYKVVGVMRPEFRWPKEADLWTPLGLARDQFTEGNRFNEHLNAVARVRAGIPVDRANALIQVLADRVRNNGTRSGAYAKDSGWGMFAEPITDAIAGTSKKPMLVLAGAVALVLLIACANIAGLMLVRGSARAREMAVRAALGAGRWNLVRQTIWDSGLLAVGGAAFGVALAFLGIRALPLLAPAKFAAGLVVTIDTRVLLFTALVSLAAAVFAGLAPAWQTSRVERFDVLKEGGRSGTTGRARQRMRAALVVGEVALALVLLIGAGLFVRSLQRLEDVGTGFEPKGIMTASVSLPETRYKEEDKKIAFYRDVIGRLSAVPGVMAAGAAVPLPFSGMNGSASFSIEGRNAGPGDPGPHGDIRYVTPGYFAALRIPLLAGRVFSEQDRIGTEPVVVIDENLARQYWQGQNPIGQHIRQFVSRAKWSTIVGVVGHVKHSDLAADSGKGVYYYAMFQQPAPYATFVVKTAGDPVMAGSAIREAVQGADASLPAYRVRALEDLVMDSLAPRRFMVALLGFFALAALFLVVIGLYGLLSFSVAQRTQEIGIRMAMGAQTGEVLALVVGEGIKLTAVGVAAGLIAAVSLNRVLASQLFHVSAFDPLTFVAMGAVLLAAAAVASYVPARRATRVDPMTALRWE